MKNKTNVHVMIQRSPSDIIAEGERLQALNALRGCTMGIPAGWQANVWDEFVVLMVNQAKKSGVTDEEINTLGLGKYLR